MGLLGRYMRVALMVLTRTSTTSLARGVSLFTRSSFSRSSWPDSVTPASSISCPLLGYVSLPAAPPGLHVAPVMRAYAALSHPCRARYQAARDYHVAEFQALAGHEERVLDDG